MPILRPQNETTCSARRQLRRCFSLILSAALALSPVISAGSETRHGHRSHSVHRALSKRGSEDNPATFEALEGDSIDMQSAAIVNGQTVKPGNLKFPAAKEALRQACKGAAINKKAKKSSQNLCLSPGEFAKSFDAAGKALGLPPTVLICLVKQESNFQPGLKSPVGARGIAQFMPATADEMAHLMRTNDHYKKAWERYKKNGGTDKSDRDVVNGNIISNFQEHADTQIFAEAMYLRKNLGPFEEKFAAGMSSRSPEHFKQMIDFLLASYNWGPGNAKKCLTSSGGFNSSCRMPKETRDYIHNIDKCIDQIAQPRGSYSRAR